MKPFQLSKRIALVLAVLATSSTHAADAPNRPNILFLLADEFDRYPSAQPKRKSK